MLLSLTGRCQAQRDKAANLEAFQEVSGHFHPVSHFPQPALLLPPLFFEGTTI